MSSGSAIRVREIGHYLLLAAGITATMAGFLPRAEFKTIALIFAVNTVISFSIGGTIDVVYRVVYPRLGIVPKHLIGWRVPLAHAGAVAVGVVGGTLLALGAVRLVYADALRYFPVVAVMQVAVPVSIAMVAVSAAVDRLRSRVRDAEEARLESELAALHARIHPHFLFNGLNTIAALIGEDQAKAEDAVVKLSTLLRHTIEGAKNLWVPLDDEIDATVQYLQFEQLRYGERLALDIRIDEGIGSVEVPPLILQPIAENAVSHGIAEQDGGRVTIEARSDGATVVLVVTDDGPGISSTSAGTQTAQRDIRKRLELAYRGRASLSIDRPERGGYRVTIVIPKERP